MTYIEIKPKKKRKKEKKKRSGSFLLFLMDFQAKESKNAHNFKPEVCKYISWWSY